MILYISKDIILFKCKTVAGITYNLTMNLTLDDGAVFKDNISIIRGAAAKNSAFQILQYNVLQ